MKVLPETCGRAAMGLHGIAATAITILFAIPLCAGGTSMIWKSVWHITSTELLTRITFAVGAAILGSLGLYLSSPIVSTLAAVCVFLLIYRLRYGRL
jgi:hypothetical protein